MLVAQLKLSRPVWNSIRNIAAGLAQHERKFSSLHKEISQFGSRPISIVNLGIPNLVPYSDRVELSHLLRDLTQSYSYKAFKKLFDRFLKLKSLYSSDLYLDNFRRLVLPRYSELEALRQDFINSLTSEQSIYLAEAHNFYKQGDFSKLSYYLESAVSNHNECNELFQILKKNGRPSKSVSSIEANLVWYFLEQSNYGHSHSFVEQLQHCKVKASSKISDFPINSVRLSPLAGYGVFAFDIKGSTSKPRAKVWQISQLLASSALKRNASLHNSTQGTESLPEEERVLISGFWGDYFYLLTKYPKQIAEHIFAISEFEPNFRDVAGGLYINYWGPERFRDNNWYLVKHNSVPGFISEELISSIGNATIEFDSELKSSDRQEQIREEFAHINRDSLVLSDVASEQDLKLETLNAEEITQNNETIPIQGYVGLYTGPFNLESSLKNLSSIEEALLLNNLLYGVKVLPKGSDSCKALGNNFVFAGAFNREIFTPSDFDDFQERMMQLGVGILPVNQFSLGHIECPLTGQKLTFVDGIPRGLSVVGALTEVATRSKEQREKFGGLDELHAYLQSQKRHQAKQLHTSSQAELIFRELRDDPNIVLNRKIIKSLIGANKLYDVKYEDVIALLLLKLKAIKKINRIKVLNDLPPSIRDFMEEQKITFELVKQSLKKLKKKAKSQIN